MNRFFEVISLSEVPIQSKPQPSKPAILIVDDEEIIAKTLSIILAKSGYATHTAFDGMSALELAEVIKPELVITDVVMPGMTGIELAITLKGKSPDCKILLFSGNAATKDLLQKAEVAAYSFEILTKPIHPHDLLRRIRECLNVHSLLSAAS